MIRRYILADPSCRTVDGSMNIPPLKIGHILVSEPCEKTYCSWGATCVVSESGKPLCQCPADCPSTSEPVCGSDNVTYTNYCHLRQTSCLKRKSTRVKHQGACGEYSSIILSPLSVPYSPGQYIGTWKTFTYSRVVYAYSIRPISASGK